MFSLFRSELYQIRKNLAVKILFLFVIITSVFLGIQEASDSYDAEYKEIGRDYINYGGGRLLSDMSDGALGKTQKYLSNILFPIIFPCHI